MNAWLLCLSCLLLVLSPPRVVTFMDFHAEGRSGAIEVFWETGSENNNIGFNLHRATLEAGPFTKITFISSQGDTITGHSYQFTDNNVEPGIRYYYKLEAIDRNTQSQWHDVIASAVATPADTPTPTSTSTPTTTPAPTATPSATPTATGTPTFSTATPTATAAPTRTFTPSPSATPAAYPGPATATPPPASATPSPTRTRLPVATGTPISPSVVPTGTGTPVTPTVTPASPAPVATETPPPTAPGPSPTPAGPSQTAFPTVPPSQPSSLASLCAQSLSYVWLIAGAAVLLALAVGFIGLMARGRRGEP